MSQGQSGRIGWVPLCGKRDNGRSRARLYDGPVAQGPHNRKVYPLRKRLLTAGYADHPYPFWTEKFGFVMDHALPPSLVAHNAGVQSPPPVSRPKAQAVVADVTDTMAPTHGSNPTRVQSNPPSSVL